MKVKVSSELSSRLAAIGPTAEQTLIKDFTAWKSGKDEFGHYFFSRDKVEKGLRHVHIVPKNNSVDLATWNRLWKARRPHLRRSDRYLLYAHDNTHGYLLIQIIDDPGAHNLWQPKNRAVLERYEIVADNFCFNGTVP